MIIFGFYGTGKSLYCENNPNCLDLDFEYFYFNRNREIPVEDEYIKTVKEKEKNFDIVFINRYYPNLQVDYGFIQDSYDNCLKTLNKRKQGNFIPSEEEYNDLKNFLLDKGIAILLKENEFIGNYGEFLISKKEYYMADLKEMQKEHDNLKTLIEQETEKLKVLEENIKAEESRQKEQHKGECIDICLDAIIVGASDLNIRHGSIAPYTTGYYINDRGNSPVEHGYCNKVTSQGGIYQTAVNLYSYLVDKKNWTYDNFKELKKESDKLWDSLPKAYTPDYYVHDDGKYLHGNHIADGYEADGFADIVKGGCGGTYSSMTTSTQNELARELIVLKGFCPDGYLISSNTCTVNVKITQIELDKKLVESVYKRHGIDSDLSDLDEWAKRNPTRCMPDKDCFISKEQCSEEMQTIGKSQKAIKREIER